MLLHGLRRMCAFQFVYYLPTMNRRFVWRERFLSYSSDQISATAAIQVNDNVIAFAGTRRGELYVIQLTRPRWVAAAIHSQAEITHIAVHVSSNGFHIITGLDNAQVKLSYFDLRRRRFSALCAENLL